MYLAASGITNDTRKRALLLYHPGARVREIFAQLEDTGTADAFDTAKQKLTAYFEPQKNKRYDVYVFRKTMQEPKYDLKAMLLDGRRDEISKFQSKEIKGKPDCREETWKPTRLR